eukprot:12160518-Heterocapsa_arctica.AAC.1
MQQRGGFFGLTAVPSRLTLLLVYDAWHRPPSCRTPSLREDEHMSTTASLFLDPRFPPNFG